MAFSGPQKRKFAGLLMRGIAAIAFLSLLVHMGGWKKTIIAALCVSAFIAWLAVAEYLLGDSK